MITENLSTLKIHKLTKEQYEKELKEGRIDPNAIYLTPDDSNEEYNKLLIRIDSLNDKINTKVDKVDGKDLSTNDFTDELKSKLDGIAENANNYVHPESHPSSMIEGFKNIYIQAEEPTNAEEGSLWIDTDEELVPHTALNSITLSLKKGVIDNDGSEKTPEFQTLNNYITTEVKYYDNLTINLLDENVLCSVCHYDKNGMFREKDAWKSISSGVDTISISKDYVRICLAAYPLHTDISHGGEYIYTPEQMLTMIRCTTEKTIKKTELSGKKWLFIGDSITEHNFRATKNYDQYLQDMLGIVPLNYGKSGTGVTYPFQENPSWLDALSTLPTDIDVISIMGGLNDRHTTLGQWGDRGTDTVYGGVWNYFNSLIAKYPNTPIIYISSTPREYSYGVDGEYTDWIDAFIKTANHFSIPVLDLYRNSGLRPWNAENNAEYFSCPTSPSGDGVHPNEKGQESIAKKIYYFALQYLT